MPREALKAKASKPGLMVVFCSWLSARARAVTSSGSCMSLGLILLMTSAAE